MSLDQPNAFVKHQSVTRDAFLGGRLTLSQPTHGFRAGLDSVLLGAAVNQAAKTLLDLGSGVGTAGFVAMVHNQTLAATLVDQNADMIALAHTNAAENGLAARTSTVVADVTARGAERRAAGLADNGFDSVIANPPFFADGTLAADAGRARSRHMDAALLEMWIKTAAGAAAARGEVIFIYPAQGLPALLSGFTARFGCVTILPLTPRPGEPANRVLLRGIKGSRAPVRLLASRPLHEAEGRIFQAEFDTIFRGGQTLVW